MSERDGDAEWLSDVDNECPSAGEEIRRLRESLAAAERERAAADALASAVEEESAAQDAYDAHSAVYEWERLSVARVARARALAAYRAARGAR